ncbi:MAG: hypothetical protein QGI83_21030 [Candidatus Latescibacteria bacterium]|nr:hypothetical protein [Candidatus Latescibacterota bacterium]
MYLKRVLLSATVLMISAFCDDILAATITYTQQTLKQETVTQIGNPGGANTVEAFQITIKNGTNVDWTDYHLRFVNPSGSVSTLPNTVSIANVALLTRPFNRSKIDLDNQLVGGGPEREAQLTLDGGVVAQGGSFKVKVSMIYSNSLTVLGEPSVPKPPTLLLLGLGIAILILFLIVRRLIGQRARSGSEGAAGG